MQTRKICWAISDVSMLLNLSNHYKFNTLSIEHEIIKIASNAQIELLDKFSQSIILVSCE